MDWPHRLYLFCTPADVATHRANAVAAWTAAGFSAADAEAQRASFVPVAWSGGLDPESGDPIGDPTLYSCDTLATEALRSALDGRLTASILAGSLVAPLAICRLAAGPDGWEVAADDAGHPAAYTVGPDGTPGAFGAPAVGAPWPWRSALDAAVAALLS